MNQIEKQPIKLGTVVEQSQEVLPPTSVKELDVPQEPAISEVSTPPFSAGTETEISPEVNQPKPRVSYGFPLELEQDSNKENPANIVAEKIQGLPPRE